MIGLQLGRNWQSGNFVYASKPPDISWLNAKASLDERPPGPIRRDTSSWEPATANYAANAQTQKQSKIDALATFRARFGLDLNGTMPYLTGGFAFIANTQNTFSVSGYNGNTGASSTFTNTQTSWLPGIVLGGGIEHQLSRQLDHIRGELLWVGFQSKNVNNPPVAESGLSEVT